MKLIRRMWSATLLFLVVNIAFTQVPNAEPKASEGEQVLFLIDDSGSMTDFGFDSARPYASRWELVQQAFPQWLARLGLNVQIGAVSVGGGCGSSPGISMPVGSDRTRISAALAAARPYGSTKLNATLRSAPSLFDSNFKGAKRIVLLSDGLNTCEPTSSSCDIAQDLYRQYGITIDVVSLVTDPSVASEFRCVASSTHGMFTMPQGFRELASIPLFKVDPWPIVAFVLAIITLILGARVLYRHAVHVLHWPSAKAILAGASMLLTGTLVVYIALFVGTTVASALLGLGLAIAVLTVLSRKASRPRGFGEGFPTRLAVLLVVSFLISNSAHAADLYPNACQKQVQGPARFHHILAVDLSGSVASYIEQMKALVACYAASYALPDEEISLIAFATDDNGAVEEVRTFTVPRNGSTDVLNNLLDDLAIQNPRHTRTYFRPLADFLNEFLTRVRLQPVVVVVSDGKSDGVVDFKSGRIRFREIPFESFGKRGIYRAPGMTGWQVAIQGGSGLDLTALFQRPVPARNEPNRPLLPLGPVLRPCLIDPQLLFDSEPELFLRPRWNPFDRTVDGSLTISVRNECVTRMRSFRVELRRGDATLLLGAVTPTPIDEKPRVFTFPVSQSATGVELAEGTVQLILDQGGTTRVIYPQKPSVVTIHEMPYWRSVGYQGVLSLLLVLAAGLAIPIFFQRRRREHRNRPEVITVLGSAPVRLHRMQTVLIGKGCELDVVDGPPGTVMARVERAATKGLLLLHSERDFLIRVAGRDVDGSIEYRLGTPLQLVYRKDGRIFDITIFVANPNDINLGSGPTTFDGGGSNGASGQSPSDFEIPALSGQNGGSNPYII